MVREVILPTAELILFYDKRIGDFPFLANGTKDLFETMIERYIPVPTWENDPYTQFVYRCGKYYGLSPKRQELSIMLLLDDWANRQPDMDIGQYLEYSNQVEIVLDRLSVDFRDMLFFLFGTRRIRLLPQTFEWFHDNLKLRFEYVRDHA